MHAHRLALALAALLAAPLASADDVSPAPAAAPAGSALAVPAALEPAMVRLASRGAIGGAPVAVEQPARIHYELGALLDLREDGARVLAVRPGEPGAAAGLQAGDRLLRINGVEARDGEALQAALASREGRFEIEAEGPAGTRRVLGQAAAVPLPGYRLEVADAGGALAQRAVDANGLPSRAAPPVEGCGIVSTRSRPPLEEQVFPAVILRIDDDSVRLDTPPSRHRLDAGRHTLVIGERIPDSRLRLQDQRDRTLLFSRELAVHREIELEVAPGMRYEIGARLLPVDQRDVRGNRYWEAVVWQASEEACR